MAGAHHDHLGPRRGGLHVRDRAVEPHRHAHAGRHRRSWVLARSRAVPDLLVSAIPPRRRADHPDDRPAHRRHVRRPGRRLDSRHARRLGPCRLALALPAQGLPAVVLGFILLFYLSDKPKDATFLSAEEKATLTGLLERDEEERRRSQPAPVKRGVTRQLLSRNMLLISFAYACLIATFSALTLWTPQIIRGMSSAAMPFWFIGVLVAVPPSCSILWMLYWTRRSDKRRERFWHCVVPMLVAAAGWATAAMMTTPALQLGGLVVASAFGLSAWPVFFTTPSIILPREAHAAGLAFLNTIGIVGSTLSPIIVGYLRDHTGGFAVPQLAIAGLLCIGVLLMMMVPRGLLESSAEP